MRLPRRTTSILASFLIATLAAPAVVVPAPRVIDDDATIVHILNRLGYGPRPGDVARVRQIGVGAWIEEQLHPEKIADPEPDRRLASLPTLHMDARELREKYELPKEAKRELQERMSKVDGDGSEDDKRALRREMMEKYGQSMAGPPREIVEELQAAKLVRATVSERQLNEVMVDFWLNHFNVYANKGPVRLLVGEYERDTIRPHAWGRFEDLLRATAESPAMLFYLDNWLSSSPNAPEMPRRFGYRRFGGYRPDRPAPKKQMRRGLNENYARELMELHTLGVDGGYTQKDVTEVARCFTGWTIDGPRAERGEPRFVFRERLHDRGDKVVLGHRIRDGGEDEGREVLHLLATRPQTAHFISYKLVRRFISDEPPAALVARAAESFQRTGGDIREVVRTIVTSPEMMAPETRTAKVKTPLELVVSALRAADAHLEDARALGRYLQRMGMPLYLQQPPTGYKDTADAWVSSSALLARLNFALDLTGGRIPGVDVDPQRLQSLPQSFTEATRATVAKEGGDLDAPRVAGLLLGSPEFQRR
jgi:uncharacterized protein (DUF1800 family)